MGNRRPTPCDAVPKAGSSVVRAVRERLALVRIWTSIALGRSYAHRPQKVGRRFASDRLDGYFNDLMGKTDYAGTLDAHGLPVLRRGGLLLHHPTEILQFGLGHWDRWLESGRSDERHVGVFRKVAQWTTENLDADGGLAVYPQLGIATEVPYSAMTQGQAASLLTRAWSVDHIPKWLEASRRAIGLMLTPVEQGGTARRVPTGIVLEEGVLTPANTVLNGWVFAAMGLRDLWLVDIERRSALIDPLDATINALIDALPAFDAGWWSRYDSAGHLASPFYHQLHVALLEALVLAFPDRARTIEPIRMRWAASSRSRVALLRAVLLKAGGQLLDPPQRLR